VEEGASVKDSIIMENCYIGRNSKLERCIVDAKCTVGEGVVIGYTEDGNIPNALRPKIYNTGITVIGEDTEIPDGMRIGQNCVIYGKTVPTDYTDSVLPSGGSILRAEKTNEGGTEE
jgi:glucose-1-phosphate adenylyltransferase